MLQQRRLRPLDMRARQLGGEIGIPLLACLENREMLAARAFHSVGHHELGTDLPLDAVDRIVGDIPEIPELASAVERLCETRD